MSPRLLIEGAPVAAPLASSHEHRAPLWGGIPARIAPGALPFPLEVLLSLAGGPA